jgi:hypothetical protein
MGGNHHVTSALGRGSDRLQGRGISLLRSVNSVRNRTAPFNRPSPGLCRVPTRETGWGTSELWKTKRWAPPEPVALRQQSNPRHAAWEAAVLPLNYARDSAEISGAGAGRQGVVSFSASEQVFRPRQSDGAYFVGSPTRGFSYRHFHWQMLPNNLRYVQGSVQWLGLFIRVSCPSSSE